MQRAATGLGPIFCPVWESTYIEHEEWNIPKKSGEVDTNRKELPVFLNVCYFFMDKRGDTLHA